MSEVQTHEVPVHRCIGLGIPRSPPRSRTCAFGSRSSPAPRVPELLAIASRAESGSGHVPAGAGRHSAADADRTAGGVGAGPCHGGSRSPLAPPRRGRRDTHKVAGHPRVNPVGSFVIDGAVVVDWRSYTEGWARQDAHGRATRPRWPVSARSAPQPREAEHK
jgi:hypothetical protein